MYSFCIWYLLSKKKKKKKEVGKLNMIAMEKAVSSTINGRCLPRMLHNEL